MLRSTHQPHRWQDAAPLPQPPLPEGWTEHKAPTGHTYYHNSATKQSTYARPAPEIASWIPPRAGSSAGLLLHTDGSHQPSFGASNTAFLDQAGMNGLFRAPYGDSTLWTESQPGRRGGGRSYAKGAHGFHDRQQRNQQQDRPKSKHPLPHSHPWLLVKTKLGRRFVFNPEKNTSFWKIPENLQEGVRDFDRLETEAQKTVLEKPSGPEQLSSQLKETKATEASSVEPVASDDLREREDESEGYEDVEVTDDEDGDDNDAVMNKRIRLDEPGDEETHEFNEEDIAYQLAAMGHDVGTAYQDDQDYEDIEREYEEPPLTQEESSALFKDLLDDFSPNPYSTWDKIIEDGKLLDDERYRVFSNMKSRKEAWSQWSRDRIHQLQEERRNAVKQDPRIPYLAFLQTCATPKLYWPEFRRKYKKEAELRDSKISDKDREKMYREHINRLKLPESKLKSDLTELLKSLPLSVLNSSTDLKTLPASLLSDMRYISLAPSTRDPMIEAYITTLQGPPTNDQSIDELDGEAQKNAEGRLRRQNALAEREARVTAEKRRQREALERGRGRLREEEQEVKRAMAVGKGGLKAQLDAAAPNLANLGSKHLTTH
ncbi:MAG: hypothetical protein M1825_005350 [Sarcosagium campestre]|nr:MAG: hypothetical protein M1825_005350 [Sarcosagium campestre]